MSAKASDTKMEKAAAEIPAAREEFNSVVAKVVTACGIAMDDVLSERAGDGKVDTKTVKDVSAVLKDISNLGGEQARQPVRVIFSPEAERYGV